MMVMWTMPTSLRARIAMATLLGIMLVPFTTSSLRGLTHVLTCTDQVTATLSVDTTSGDDTILLGADSTTRDEAADPTLCGGLRVSLSLTSTQNRRANVLVRVTNDTEYDWQGSIELQLEGTSIPVAIGRIDAGSSADDTVQLRVHSGRSYDISGTLLIGP